MKDKNVNLKNLKLNEKYFLIDEGEPFNKMIKKIEIVDIMPAFGATQFFYCYINETVTYGFSIQKHVIRECDKIYKNKNDALIGIVQILENKIKKCTREIKT